MTTSVKSLGQDRIAIAFSERDPGSPFRLITGNKPDFWSISDGSADVVLVENLHCRDSGQSITYLREILRSMRAGGLLRVSVPNLDAAVHAYLMDRDDSRDSSRATRFNNWLRETGAKFIFNEEDLRQVLLEAGFVDLRHFIAGASSDPLFWEIEEADKTLLVLEARKPKDIR